MLTPPEIRTPRPVSFEMLKVWRMGERGRGEMGGEALDMPSGELLLLWIWERRWGREGERKEPDKQNYKGERRRKEEGRREEGGGGKEEEEGRRRRRKGGGGKKEERKRRGGGEGRRGVFHAGLQLVFTAYNCEINHYDAIAQYCHVKLLSKMAKKKSRYTVYKI